MLVSIKNFFQRQVIYISILLITIFLTIYIKKFNNSQKEESHTSNIPNVVVEQSVAENKIYDLDLLGYVTASDKIDIKSDISGKILSISVSQGDEVKKSQTLAIIANVEHFKLLEKEILDAKTSQPMTFSKGYHLTAPFDGTIQEIYIENGETISFGEKIMKLVGKNNFHIKLQVPEQYLHQINSDIKPIIKLKDKKILDANVSFVGKHVSLDTRSFNVELSVKEATNLIDGMIVDVKLPIKNIKAHKIARSTLTLSENGDIGVKIIDQNNQVKFIPANIFTDEDDFLWIYNVDDKINIVTLGQNYVKDGDEVKTNIKDERNH